MSLDPKRLRALLEMRDKQTGLVVFLIGLAFNTLGLLMAFDRGFLALGNVLMTTGMLVFLGVHQAYRVFFSGSSVFATLAYFAGLVLVLLKYVILGGILQVSGFFCLFRPFAMVYSSLLARLPLVGPVFALLGGRGSEE